MPKTRTDWWLNKINGNISNDTKAIKALKKAGWKIINLWECNLKPAKINKTLPKLLKKSIEVLIKVMMAPKCTYINNLRTRKN